MSNRAVRLRSWMALAGVAALLAACSPPNPSRPEPPLPSNAQMVQAIRAAGASDKSVINVHPLRDPGVTSLRDAAISNELAGQYAQAAQHLDEALKMSPDAPDLLQDRAEVAVYLGDYAMAGQLAHRSWSLGPKLGPLCERNWQTIVELDLHARDAVSAASARKQVAACHKADIPRF
ncbi:tetratricopeptide repeat protein [Dyella sp. A6]|uniref:tetratricopeptide repeat protein n=1 Tax=Dyella aluminiiresistens TaxID=3069105 RepID=UPI002E76105B|nr:tetratricopeptide repeat protein [Dyella sp. A6]